MTCTLLVAAPIMCVGGIVMALRQDLGLSWLMRGQRAGAAASRSALIVIADGAAVPADADPASTRVNRVLREQITGIRVVRAFVREPDETQRFGGANADLTETALRAGRLHGAHVPDRDAGAQRLQRRGALVRRRAGSTPARCRSAR